MVTIIVDTDTEYVEMEACAERYICGQAPLVECMRYEPGIVGNVIKTTMKNMA